MADCKDAIERYLGFKAANTQRRYRTVLSDLRRYLAGRSVARVTPETALDYVRILVERKQSDATVANSVALLSALYRHLADLQLVRGNPWALARFAIPSRRRVQVRPTKLVPLELVSEICQLPDPRTKEGRRDRAILAVLFGGGLRRSEVISLDMRDVIIKVDGESGRLVIRSPKAGYRQEQELPAWAVEALSILVSQRSGDGAVPISPLFPIYDKDGRERGRMSDVTLYRLYKRYLEEVGLDDYAPHSARATAATAALQAGATDRQVRDLLRHSTTRMVEAYDKRRSANADVANLVRYSAK